MLPSLLAKVTYSWVFRPTLLGSVFRLSFHQNVTRHPHLLAMLFLEVFLCPLGILCCSTKIHLDAFISSPLLTVAAVLMFTCLRLSVVQFPIELWSCHMTLVFHHCNPLSIWPTFPTYQLWPILFFQPTA